MSDQVRIDPKEMEKLRNQAKKKQREEKEKEKLTPGALAFRIFAVAVVVAYLVLLIFGKHFLPENGVFLSSLNVFKESENPNAWIRAISLGILVLCASRILRFFIDKLSQNKNVTKKTGVAVIELLGNLVKYAAILILVFLLLSALGVNTAEILAGLGILTLILGLGMTSLIEDIVAGIFIIAEHLFDVGDVIVLDGFRGTVVRIGIRSTQLMDVGGDDLIVRNSSIGSLVNLTYRMSSAAVTFPLAPTESLERVEEIVKNSDFDKIGEKYPAMQSGPLYLGMCGIDSKGVQSLLIVCGCKEADKYECERIMFKEFKILMESHGIKLGATGIEEG